MFATAGWCLSLRSNGRKRCCGNLTGDGLVVLVVRHWQTSQRCCLLCLGLSLCYFCGGGRKKAFSYCVFDLQLVRSQFRFPMQHPIDGVVYSCCEAKPDLYVPLAASHRFMCEAKIAAFLELCAGLGVRRCAVAYAEEDGRDVTASAAAGNLPMLGGLVSGKIEGKVGSSAKESAHVMLELPFPRNPLQRVESGWIAGEPTWDGMQRMRLEGGVERCRVQLNYRDEMGVTAKVAAHLFGLGLEVGGEFEAFHSRHWLLDVEFWPSVHRQSKKNDLGGLDAVC